MTMLFQILQVLGQTIWGVISVVFPLIWHNLPEILQIKKILGYFTPVGAIALYFGVPTIVITIIIKIIKKAVKG